MRLEVATLGSGVVTHVLEHARRAAPDECCGVLIGRGYRVDEAVAAGNIADHPTTRFQLDPKDHLDALRGARQRGLDVVGFYHSHPRSAGAPSASDIEEASYPNHLFLIVGIGVEPPDIQLYRFTESAFRRVAFETE